MALVVTDACIRCKFTDCVEVCPVDAFHEGLNMLVINPDVCICCNVCARECPVEAIVTDFEPAGVEWAELNKTYSAVWPVISHRGQPPEDADEHRGEAGKFERYFSPGPGAG